MTAILTHAAKRGWCDRPAFERPREPPGRTRWLTVDEAEALIAASADHLRPLVVLMLYTGARLGEAMFLDWREVDLARGMVRYVDTKNGHARGVPLHPRAVAELANLGGRTGPVFRRADGQPFDTAQKTNTQIATAWKAARRAAGLPASRHEDHLEPGVDQSGRRRRTDRALAAALRREGQPSHRACPPGGPANSPPAR